MTPHNLIPWRREKGEEEDEEGGGSGRLHPACPRPSHHSPQNHIYFALTRWAVLSCWNLRRETDRRRDRHSVVGADRTGGSRHHHAMPRHATPPSGAWRPCKNEECAPSKGSEGDDYMGVSDSEAAAGRVRSSCASVSGEEVAARRWLAPPAACGSPYNSGCGSWSPPPPMCTHQLRTSPTPSPSARCAHSPVLLKMGVPPFLMWVLLLALAGLGGRVGVMASEFPDRECCDSAPPPPPHYHTTTSTTPVPLVRTFSTTNTPPPPSFFPIASISPTGEGVAGVKNCLLARQLCDDDIYCRSVLEIIPRLCGPENVACSTVTVNKCLAALRTILGFPYFQPTCLCREPHLDQECNVFREFIFDHPCHFVENRNEAPYAVHALPLCEYTLQTCQKLPGCMNLYDGFRNACKVKDDQCKMTDTNKCLSAWTKLKMSPMFGCICNDRQKHNCEKIFRKVHRNPCVDEFPASSALPSPGQGVWRLMLPPPPTPRPRLPPLPPLPRPHHYPRPNTPWAAVPYPPHVTSVTARPQPAYSAQTHNVLTVERHTTTTSSSSRTAGNSHGSFPVSVIPSDNSSRHVVDTQIQNPLMETGQGGGRRQNASRAVNVLGNAYGLQPTDPHASHIPLPVSRPPALHSTCHTALQACNKDKSCRHLLDPVLAVCDTNQCNREACMSNVQTFYRNVVFKWALEVAFCLCRRSSSVVDQCMVAQEKLHPSCARKPAGSAPMLCSRLAAACKENPACRPRLEFYEQACAVDSDTQRCAGSTAECRRAVLGILGTQLRNLCTCAASDPRETFTCMDWLRILWHNPCVVESQADYHREMLNALGPTVEVTTTGSIYMPTTITMEGMNEVVKDNGHLPHPSVIHPTFAAPSTFYPPIYVPRPTHGYRYTTPTTTTTTTTTTVATMLPPKSCEKRHANDDTTDYIEEGWGKRYYKGEECSELCLCHAEEKLACSVLECVEARPCETDYAVYTHAAPAYQAARGECFCYSGAFICVRPPKGSYDLHFGVFLFLGYSKAEEQLLRPYTKISLVDAAMDKLGNMVQESANIVNGRDRRVTDPDFRQTKSTCQLERLLHDNENIILQATLEEFDDVRDNMSFAMLEREKIACEEAVTELSQKINIHAQDVREDMALSVLILAEVQVHLPPKPDSASLSCCSPPLLLFLATLTSLHHILLAS